MTKHHHWQDARLKKALENAPDAQIQPSRTTRDTIKKAAYSAVEPQRTKQAQSWWKRCFSAESARKVHMPWNAAFATLLVAGCVVLLWTLNNPQPISDHQPPPPASAPYAPTRSATSSTAPSGTAATLSDAPSSALASERSDYSPPPNSATFHTIAGTYPVPAPASVPTPAPALEIPPAPMMPADIAPPALPAPTQISPPRDAPIIAQPTPALAPARRLQIEQSAQNAAEHSAHNEISPVQRSAPTHESLSIPAPSVHIDTSRSRTTQEAALEQSHAPRSTMQRPGTTFCQKKPKTHSRSPLN